MAKLSRTAANDASKPFPKHGVIFDGDRRVEIRPRGVVERFVDPQGNVVSLQLRSPGDLIPEETVRRNRSRLHVQGFVEHTKCPLRHGIRFASPANERAFADIPADLQRPCGEDEEPKAALVRRGSAIHANKACAHVEWLIESRRAKAAAELLDSNPHRAVVEQREADRRELEQLQLEKAREELKQMRAKSLRGGAKQADAQ